MPFAYQMLWEAKGSCFERSPDLSLPHLCGSASLREPHPSFQIPKSTLHLTFGIPQGFDGSDGPPGEVSQQDLDDAINGTSNNSDQVGTLSMAVEDPPSQNDVQTIADKVDELLLALRRN